ncbi:hypothetical protein SISNIDRAFT_484150 [Sistotremastrum niveocremeum HHB9708]|uniref:Uncharacterized protein n=1 Tax=Sistotremastrum niveocremeum HHB9708 TaxID=1314777 RepID=A0A164WRG2_9AGAM|nr:hypothetical protein SISNIDRAFT_484150 [Sistotremastrum niveocremeum HHB9708]
MAPKLFERNRTFTASQGLFEPPGRAQLQASTISQGHRLAQGNFGFPGRNRSINQGSLHANGVLPRVSQNTSVSASGNATGTGFESVTSAVVHTGSDPPDQGAQTDHTNHNFQVSHCDTSAGRGYPEGPHNYYASGTAPGIARPKKDRRRQTQHERNTKKKREKAYDRVRSALEGVGAKVPPYLPDTLSCVADTILSFSAKIQELEANSQDFQATNQELEAKIQDLQARMRKSAALLGDAIGYMSTQTTSGTFQINHLLEAYRLIVTSDDKVDSSSKADSNNDDGIECDDEDRW